MRNLRLRAGSAAEAHRSATTLGDALHTASFPGEISGRLLAIRRLALGRIRPTNTPGTLALSVERAVRESISRAVWFDVPEARHANVIAFPDRGAALVALARRLAQRDDTSAWFWDQIVPGWSACPTREAQWRGLLAAAHEGDAATATVAAVVAEVVRVRQQSCAEILGAVSRAEAELWLFTLGFSAVHSRRESGSPRALSPVFAAALERVLEAVEFDPVQRRTSAHEHSTDQAQPEPKLIWLTTLLALEVQPAWSAQSDLPAHVAAWLQRQTVADREPTTTRIAPDDAGTTRSASTTKLQRAEAASADSVQPESAEEAPKTSVREPREGTGEISPFAGLLFVVPVLQRLGLPQRLQDDPRLVADAFAARVLLNVGCRVGMPLDDPLARALTARIERESPCSGEIRDAVALGHVHARDALLTPWFAAVRAWLRRRAQLTVVDLIRRRGRLDATRTHLDLCFEPAQADVRLRRLALDVDPGWVPWLGCVIRFHYETSHERRD